MSNKKVAWPCVDCRIMMVLVDEDHCKCPECGTEVWFDYNTELSRDDIKDLMRDNLSKHQQTVYDAMIGGEPIKGGGGGRSNRSNSKKQALRKPPTSELYNRLAKSWRTLKNLVWWACILMLNDNLTKNTGAAHTLSGFFYRYYRNMFPFVENSI